MRGGGGYDRMGGERGEGGVRGERGMAQTREKRGGDDIQWEMGYEKKVEKGYRIEGKMEGKMGGE